MANIVGIQWGSRTARLILAEQRRGELILRRMKSLDVSDSKQSVVDTIQDWGVGRAPVIVAVDRAVCELRVVAVPPVPAFELPDIVRFQAMQQFAAVGDASPLDYLPIEHDSMTPQAGDFGLSADAASPQVLAAAIPTQELEQIRRCCEANGLALQGVILAACGTAEVVRRLASGGSTARRIALDLQNDTAEIVVADGPRLLMTRSVRLVGESDSPESLRMVVVELRRTLAAVRSQFPGRDVGGIVVCGDSEQHDALRLRTAEEFQVPVESMNPLPSCRVDSQLSKERVDYPGRYTSLIGALLCETTVGTEHCIDFLRPRRPQAARDLRKFWTTAATVILAAALLVGLSTWWALASRDREIADLRREITEVDKLVELANEQQQALDRLDRWYADSPNWLLEMRGLAERLPSADQLKIERLQADISSDRGGRIVVKGLVDSSSTVSLLESRLRDDYHRVEGMDRDYLGDDPRYPWFFMEKIDVSADASAAAMKKLASPEDHAVDSKDDEQAVETPNTAVTDNVDQPSESDS